MAVCVKTKCRTKKLGFKKEHANFHQIHLKADSEHMDELSSL